jgi:hypothetical protein
MLLNLIESQHSNLRRNRPKRHFHEEERQFIRSAVKASSWSCIFEFRHSVFPAWQVIEASRIPIIGE